MTLTFPDSLFPDTQTIFPRVAPGLMPNEFSLAAPTILFQKAERWQLNAQWDYTTDIPSSADRIKQESSRRELTAFFTKVRVGRDSFFMPNHTAPQRGTFTGTPVVGVESQTGTSLILGGGLMGEDDWFKPGDFISVNCQLLMVLNEVDSDAGGVGSLQVWPPVRVAPNSGTTVITSGAFGVFDLIGDPVISVYRPGRHGSIIIQALEHISSADLV